MPAASRLLVFPFPTRGTSRTASEASPDWLLNQKVPPQSAGRERTPIPRAVRTGLGKLLRRCPGREAGPGPHVHSSGGIRRQGQSAVHGGHQLPALGRSISGATRPFSAAPCALTRRQVTIVGVAPPEFRGDFPGVRLDGWIPVPLTGEGDRGARHFLAIVRLKPGVSVSEANAEAATVAARLARAFRLTKCWIVPVGSLEKVSGVSALAHGHPR